MSVDYASADMPDIGTDTTAAFARKALHDAGITREQARKMTLSQLKKIPGMGWAEVYRLEAHGIYSDNEIEP